MESYFWITVPDDRGVSSQEVWLLSFKAHLEKDPELYSGSEYPVASQIIQDFYWLEPMSE